MDFFTNVLSNCITLNPNEPTQNPSEMNSEKTKMTDLPEEVLEIIFLNLSQQDLHQNLVLVCQTFRNIIRHPKFAPIVKIEIISGKWDIGCIEKAEKALKIYPNAKIDISYNVTEYRYVNSMAYWMKNLRKIQSSISKMSIQCSLKDIELFSSLAQLENLESLDLNIDYRFYQDWIEFENMNFFPSLKFLKIRTNRQFKVSTCMN